MFLAKLKHSYFVSLSILILTIVVCLMLLPIEGDCGWTYMDEGYSSFSDSYSESDGGGWTLSGSVSASSGGASAYMGPSISNATAFNGSFRERVADYTGSATVEASRAECYARVYCSGGCYARGYGGCWGHWKTVPAKTDSGNGSFLQAWVLMVKEESMKVYGVATSDSSLTLTLNVSLFDERAVVGAQWTSGGKTYTTQSSTKITKVIPQVQPSESVYASVSGRAEASKSAWCAYITFAGNSYSSADASYATYGE